MNDTLKNLPTDNLYKFLSLSGVVVAVASVYMFVSKVYEYKDDLIKHKEEIEFIGFLTQAGAAIGILAAVIAFYLWYKKIQEPMDKELKAKAECALLEVKKSKDDILISKYIKIYEGINTLQSNVGSMNVYLIGKIGYGVKFDPSKFPIHNHSELHMYILFYAPELTSKFEEIDKFKRQFDRLITDFISNTKPTEEKNVEYVSSGIKITNKIHELTDELKNEVSCIVQNVKSHA